jgi:hypothetical protein
VKTPFVIFPEGVYTPAIVTERLGLAKGTMPREIRLRRLRVSKRGGRYYLLGSWVLDWLRGGEVRRARNTAPREGDGSLRHNGQPDPGRPENTTSL